MSWKGIKTFVHITNKTTGYSVQPDWFDPFTTGIHVYLNTVCTSSGVGHLIVCFTLFYLPFICFQTLGLSFIQCYTKLKNNKPGPE